MFDFSKHQEDLGLLTKFVMDACCIYLGEDKSYLFQARLGKLIAETGSADIPEFIRMIQADTTGRLRDKIIDAITTHETSWFRDARPWAAIEEHLLPELAAQVASGKKNNIRILSAACSTGQEPYSIALLLHKLFHQNRLHGVSLSCFEINGFDISPGTLYLAVAGRYSKLEISRGLPDFWRDHYFHPTAANTWTIKDSVRKMVTFKRRNLQDNFALLGQFDLVLCRNVAIYFKEDFKKDLFNRMGSIIFPGGHLMLGGTESLLTHQHLFETNRIGNAIFYKRKPN